MKKFHPTLLLPNEWQYLRRILKQSISNKRMVSSTWWICNGWWCCCILPREWRAGLVCLSCDWGRTRGWQKRESTLRAQHARETATSGVAVKFIYESIGAECIEHATPVLRERELLWCFEGSWEWNGEGLLMIHQGHAVRILAWFCCWLWTNCEVIHCQNNNCFSFIYFVATLVAIE